MFGDTSIYSVKVSFNFYVYGNLVRSLNKMCIECVNVLLGSSPITKDVNNLSFFNVWWLYG